MRDMEPSKVLRFDEYEVDLRAGEVRKSGSRINLQRQPFAILSSLLERPGDLILRDELRQRLWRDDVFVDFEHSVNRSINKLRDALNDDAESPRFIETIPGRGYRFVAPLTNLAPRPLVRIAVLPIENATGDPENDYLAEGATEALIDALGRQLSGQIRVTALSSVLRFRHLALAIPDIAAELGVERILTGRLRRTPEALRIRLELVDVRDHVALWVKSATLADGSDLRFCEEVPAELARSLESAPSIASQSANPVAHDISEARQAYMRGRYFWNQRTPEAMKRAIEYFRWATEKDPNYVAPHVGLAESYIALSTWGAVHPKQAIVIAHESAKKALALDPSHAEAHVVMAWSHMVLRSDWPSAEQEFRTAIELNSSNSIAYHWYAFFLMAQRAVSESLDMSRRALDVDPLSIPINGLRGWLLFCAGRYEDAIAQCRRTCELEVSHPQPHSYLAMAYDLLGRHEDAIAEARQSVAIGSGMPILRMILAYMYASAGYRDLSLEILRELEQLASSSYLSPFWMAIAYAGLRKHDEALTWLEKGFNDAEVWMLFTAHDPRFRELHSDPRFADLIRRLPQLRSGDSSIP